MTPARFLILLAIVVPVLFSVSLAIRNKTGDSRVNKPTNSWASRFNKRFEERQKIPPEELHSPCRSDRQLRIPRTLMQCTINVVATNRNVRKAELTLNGADKFKLEYRPSPEDLQAVPVRIDQFKPGKSIKLVFQKNGGQLTLTRVGVAADATIHIN